MSVQDTKLKERKFQNWIEFCMQFILQKGDKKHEKDNVLYKCDP